jgi:mannose-6-phosphate isomerase-like protein (cupin superfamily)
MASPVLALVALLCAGPVEIWPSGTLKSSGDQLGAEADAKGIAGKTLGGASLWRRSKSGQAELHKTKTDIIVVQQGGATLVFGGAVEAPKISAPNEMRGASIRGGESKKLSPGDIVRIPSGTPHQFILAKGESIAYFALKIPR